MSPERRWVDLSDEVLTATKKPESSDYMLRCPRCGKPACECKAPPRTLPISELKPGMSRLLVSGRIAAIGHPREVTTRLGPARVAIATLEDETGSVKLNLWQEQIEKVREGDVVRLENAFSKDFRGTVELSLGRSGTIALAGRRPVSK